LFLSYSLLSLGFLSSSFPLEDAPSAEAELRDGLAALTAHIPKAAEHLVRYDGW
jgi:hypothetical protein